MSALFSGIVEKFKKNNQCLSCKYIDSSIVFDCNNKVRLCPYYDIGIINEKFDGIWLDTDKVIKTKEEFVSEFKQNNIPENGKECFNLENKLTCNSNTLKYLYISNWQHCYLNCSYCDSPKEEDLKKVGHYDIFPIIKQLTDSKLLTQETKVIFECGDPCIHPEFDKIIYHFINYEMRNIVINTPAQRFCESVAEAVAKNIAEVIITFDSGCPYVYGLVKGSNKFDIAMANIKKYLSYQEPKEKRVMLKYNIINGINDNQKEILDWFILSRDTGIKKLVIDIDRKWYNQIKYSVPQYLKELLIFAKHISEYNNMEIEFCENALAIYKRISKEEK